MPRLALLLICVAIAACGGEPASTPARTLGTGEQWLPVARWGGNNTLCGGGGFVGVFTLHGAPADPRLAWMTGTDGTRAELGMACRVRRPLRPDARSAR